MPILNFIIGKDSYHRRVVLGVDFLYRGEEMVLSELRFSFYRFEESIISAYSSGKHDRRNIIDFCCMKKFMREDIYHRLFKFKSDFLNVFFSKLSSFIDFSFYSAFDTRERKIMTIFIK